MMTRLCRWIIDESDRDRDRARVGSLAFITHLDTTRRQQALEDKERNSSQQIMSCKEDLAHTHILTKNITEGKQES